MKKLYLALLISGATLPLSIAWAESRPTYGGHVELGSSEKGFILGGKAFVTQESTGAGASVGATVFTPDQKDEFGRPQKKGNTARFPVEARLPMIPIVASAEASIIPGAAKGWQMNADVKQANMGILYSPLELNGQLSWESKEPGHNLFRNTYGLAQSKFKFQLGGQSVGVAIPTNEDSAVRATKAVSAEAYVGGGSAFGFVVPSTGQVQAVGGPALSAGAVIRTSKIGSYSSPALTVVAGAELTRVLSINPGAPELAIGKASLDLIASEFGGYYPGQKSTVKSAGEMSLGIAVSGAKYKVLQGGSSVRELKDEGSHMIEFHVGGAY